MMKKRLWRWCGCGLLALTAGLAAAACGRGPEGGLGAPARSSSSAQPTSLSPVAVKTPVPATPLERVIRAGVEQTNYTFYYDPAYVKLAYPGGDVPAERGVCADVIVRAFRAGGVDLQKEVHEDMRDNFAAYPRRWGNRATDPNIDHRRVINLMVFFERRGRALPVTSEARDYEAGDVVAWDLGGGLRHIGMVTDVPNETGRVPLVVHNINSGARLEDVLFAWKILGHYRFFARASAAVSPSGR